jgi:hypothetical protein
MPFYEPDPWRQQYFRDVNCPDEVHIATDDPTAFALHRGQQWVYDKLLVVQSQGLTCGEWGVGAVCCAILPSSANSAGRAISG